MFLDELFPIEKVIDQLKDKYGYDCYEYSNKEQTFSAVTRNHFKDITKNLYGVYIIREKKTSKILYIGKAGTFDNKARSYKDQDLPKRLSKGKRGKGEERNTSNKWMKKLCNERGGALLIEYLVLEELKQPAPAFIEALLLQSFLNEFNRLPPKNSTF